jgi:hypothetical protein
VCDLTVLPCGKRDDHIKENNEKRDYRRLDTEWQYRGRNAGLKVDIRRHKHLKEKAGASEQKNAILPSLWPRSELDRVEAVDERPNEGPDHAPRPAL